MTVETMKSMKKNIGSPDVVRDCGHGRMELATVEDTTLAKVTLKPGWKWSVDVGPSLGLTRCPVEHVGLVLSGVATAAFEDGSVVHLRAGELFHIPATPHDSWVVGEQPYVSLHFLGAEHYASR